MACGTPLEVNRAKFCEFRLISCKKWRISSRILLWPDLSDTSHENSLDFIFLEFAQLPLAFVFEYLARFSWRP